MKTVRLTTPLSQKEIENLELGDLVYINGLVFTCRGLFQRRVIDEGLSPPIDTAKINVMVHVGPIVKKNEFWKVVSLQPTTSNRFEKWGPQTIETLGLRMIIGKGTMGPATAAAMKKFGCVHLTSVGVLGTLHPQTVQVKNVYWYELGPIEATWVLEAKNFGPFRVDIDTNGKRYFEQIDKVIAAKQQELYEKLKIPQKFKYENLNS